MQVVIGAIVKRDRRIVERKRRFPIRRQKAFRPGWFTDVCHWVFNQTIVNVGVVIGAIPLYILLGWAINPSFQSQAARQPGYLQLLEAMSLERTAAGIALCRIKLLCSTSPIPQDTPPVEVSLLSPQSANTWTGAACVRFHPVDMIAARLGIGVPLVILGFSAETFGFYIVFNVIQSIFIHANVRCRLLGLRWLIGEAPLHHWHLEQGCPQQEFWSSTNRSAVRNGCITQHLVTSPARLG